MRLLIMTALLLTLGGCARTAHKNVTRYPASKGMVKANRDFQAQCHKNSGQYKNQGCYCGNSGAYFNPFHQGCE